MIKVGITGGIGSGKSTIAQVFETLGVPVYYADAAAKRLMNENEVLKKQLQQAFGEDIYKDGILDRTHLATIVFQDPHKLQLLNSLVHPATIADAANWMQLQKTPYAIKEAALIFESGAQKHLDYVIGVYAPVALRIQRVMERDHTTRQAVQTRMARQMDENIKMKLCEFVITNDEQELVIPQVLAVHKLLSGT